MTTTEHLLGPAEAARRLGVSVKALRLYERHGLIAPQRNISGWRFYGHEAMARGERIVFLRALGMSLKDVAALLAGQQGVLDDVLATHQRRLEGQIAGQASRLAELRQLRDALAAGGRGVADAAYATLNLTGPALVLELPWPWGGERFEVPPLQPLTWLTGPLGSGKTQLARALCEALGGRFSGMDRVAGDMVRTLEPEAEATLRWLLDDGASDSLPLRALVADLCAASAPAVVVDLVEEGLDEASQEAVGAWLRRYDRTDRPLIVMTRSTAILDLEIATPEQRILFCPANHAPPQLVLPIAGAAGFEAVASCLGAPEVRQRTAGMVAAMPQ